MKKNHLLGFVWIAVAILLSVILALELTAKGSSHNLGKWFSGSFTGDNSIENGSAVSSQQNLFAADGIKHVKAELNNISLEVSRSADSDIHLDFLNGAEEKCTLSNSNGRIRVSQKKLMNGNKGRILIKLPASYSGNLWVESNSASVNVAGVNLSEFDVEIVSGSIKIDGCVISSLEAEAVSGSIDADGAFEQISAESVSGSIKIASSKALKRKTKFESVSGSVSLNIPASSDYSLQYESMSGRFNDKITNASGSKEGSSVNGNGSVPISVSTVSGSIQIQSY